VNDMVVFGIGVFVTAISTTSIALLAWAAWTTDESAHSHPQEPEVIRLVKPNPGSLQSRGLSGRQTG